MVNTSIKSRFFVSLCALAACGAACFHSTALAQQPAIHVVTGDNVYVRSGPADSYYPFGRVNRGNLVEVIGEKFNWTRVTVRGPSFKPGTDAGEFFGYIIHPANEAGTLRVSDDGKRGTTLGRVDVLAPNLDTNFNPENSWKPLIRLEANTNVTILATSESGNNLVHRVVLPESAEAWISTSFLREATVEEVAAWNRALTGAKVEPTKAKEKAAGGEGKVEEKVQEKPAQDAPRTEEKADADRKPEDRPKPQAADEPEKDAAPVQDVRKITMEDLEVLFVKLRETPAEIAELTHLREMYQEFAVRNSQDRTMVRFAGARAEQLQIWREIREKQAELDRIRNRAQMQAERAESARLAIYSHTNYDAIGRLAASTIYDGQRLPRMLRLREPGTGRTLAYIEPETDEFDLYEMIGQWVGIVGERSYDPALRLNIITPRRIDLLAPH